MKWILIFLAVGSALSVSNAQAQAPDEEAAVIAAVVEHLREVRGPHPAYEPDNQVVIDPGLDVHAPRMNGRLNQARAERVARLTNTRAARLQDVMHCTGRPEELGVCRLRVGQVFRFGEAEIAEAEARVEVLEWFSEPELRDPMPMLFSEVLLRRTPAGWEVTELKLIWRS